MSTQGELRIDPECLRPSGIDNGRMPDEMEIVVPYTEWSVTDALLHRACEMTAGLNAHIKLVAVHTIPYPATFGCPAAVHAHLVEQLIDLAGRCSLPVTPQVVLARDREEGFLFALEHESTVLVGSPRRLWRTAGERLARGLARHGHKVILVHIP